MKIAMYTEALGSYVSGGIACIVHTLNALAMKGHEVACFIEQKPYRSDWIPAAFPIIPSKDKMYRDYDGVLISPFSPTAHKVAEHPNASDKLYWVHSCENLFSHNGKAWQERAINSYSLPVKMICVSTYLQILMEMVYNRNVIGQKVPAGIDEWTFSTQNRERMCHIDGPLRVVVFGRQDWVRGYDISLLGIKLAQNREIPIEVKIIPQGTTSRVAVAEVMRWGDLFIDTSRLAGSSVVLKEAMACGSVPISTYYGAPDFVYDGVNGFIIPPNRPVAVADAIETYYGLPAEKKYSMHELAQVITREYTWDKVADMLLRAIEEGQERHDELLRPKSWGGKDSA